MKRITLLFSLVLLLFGCLMARADVKLAPLFTDDMVLQRDKPVPVWGAADAGAKITVSMDLDQEKLLPGAYSILLPVMRAEATADASGYWRATLPAMHASKVGQQTLLYTMTVKNDKDANPLILKNVAIGDVYICSGQSNMEFGVGNLANAAEEIAAANYPNLRLFMVPHQISGTPQKTFSAPVQWKICTPENIARGGWRGFSAVAYFFGRELNQKLGVPIGLIESSWGGTVAQAWTSRDTLLKRDDFRDATLKTEERLAAPATEPPAKPNPNQPTVLYNGMIAPLLPFAMRGVIWYQGEANANKPDQYRTLFPDLIRDWRAHWNAKQDGSEFGFYFVQLASFMARTGQPVQSGWAELRDAQTHTLQVVPRTGMATIIDIGDAQNIHPKDKQDVGKRLALVALAKEYGQNVEYSGPVFKAMKVEGSKARIEFSYVKGLATTDAQTPRSFAVQDESGKWYAASTRIEGENVVVWSDGVLKPKAVAYAWANNPDVNLVNAAGLPAVPFRTDAS
jgi:sialate O-acetylesterase